VAVLIVSRGASKTEDAVELYVKAGNSFKMAKKWSGMFSFLLVYLNFANL